MIFAALGVGAQRVKGSVAETYASLDPSRPGNAFQHHTILIGYGRVGGHLAELLQARGGPGCRGCKR